MPTELRTRSIGWAICRLVIDDKGSFLYLLAVHDWLGFRAFRLLSRCRDSVAILRSRGTGPAGLAGGWEPRGFQTAGVSGGAVAAYFSSAHQGIVAMHPIPCRVLWRLPVHCSLGALHCGHRVIVRVGTTGPRRPTAMAHWGRSGRDTS
jgi:hypothetical protein